MNLNENFLASIRNKLTPEQYLELQNALKNSLIEKPRQHLNRIPFLLPLIGTFGLVTTFYGFEKILDKTNLINYPWEMIGIGVVILLLTGAAATKL